MYKTSFLILCFFFTIKTNEQSNTGQLSSGMRSIISLFDHDENAKIGYGTSGQFWTKLQYIKR